MQKNDVLPFQSQLSYCRFAKSDRKAKISGTFRPLIFYIKIRYNP